MPQMDNEVHPLSKTCTLEENCQRNGSANENLPNTHGVPLERERQVNMACK